MAPSDWRRGGKEKKSWRDATVASSMMTRRDVIFIVLINQ